MSIDSTETKGGERERERKEEGKRERKKGGRHRSEREMK